MINKKKYYNNVDYYNDGNGGHIICLERFDFVIYEFL